ncbi:hypothetical protein PPACK8108_LOCUS3562 [Phakopsora pachyrhizi]|uniref:Uncharacterized protein n=1 Tax=Phakopsora pachyrhizi TaxID=170000 RepID=A0AAV0AM41_PHAPC|nr:hypothetical protein PPACK8108_LOCUS3562 [Phakopsora pachyrhizi]
MCSICTSGQLWNMQCSVTFKDINGTPSSTAKPVSDSINDGLAILPQAFIDGIDQMPLKLVRLEGTCLKVKEMIGRLQDQAVQAYQVGSTSCKKTMISAKSLDRDGNNNLNQKVQILIEKVQNLEEKFLVNNNEREELILCSDKKPGGSLDNQESINKIIDEAFNRKAREWRLGIARQNDEMNDVLGGVMKQIFNLENMFKNIKYNKVLNDHLNSEVNLYLSDMSEKAADIVFDNIIKAADEQIVTKVEEDVHKKVSKKWIEVQTALTTVSRALNLMEFEWGRLATQTKEISDYVELNGPMGVFLVNSLQSLNLGNNLEEPGEGASKSLKRKVIERNNDHDDEIGEHTLADCKGKKRAF